MGKKITKAELEKQAAAMAAELESLKAAASAAASAAAEAQQEAAEAKAALAALASAKAPRVQRARAEKPAPLDERLGLRKLLDGGFTAVLDKDPSARVYTLAEITGPDGAPLRDTRSVSLNGATLNLGHLRGPSKDKEPWTSAVVRHDYTVIDVPAFQLLRPDFGEFLGSAVKFNNAGELAFFESGLCAHLTYDGEHSLAIQRWVLDPVTGLPVTGIPTIVGTHRQKIADKIVSLDVERVASPSPRDTERLYQYLALGAKYREEEMGSLTRRASARLFTLLSPQNSSLHKFCLAWKDKHRVGQDVTWVDY